MEENITIPFKGNIGHINKNELKIHHNGHRITIPIESINKIMLLKRKKLLKNYLFFLFTSLITVLPVITLTSSFKIGIILLIIITTLTSLIIKDFEYIFLIVKDYEFFEVKIRQKNMDEAKKILELIKEIKKKNVSKLKSDY